MHGRGRSGGGRAEGRAQLYHRRLGIPGAGNQGIVNELRRTLTIVNQRGLHARASAKFVNAVSQLPDGTRVRVAKDGNEAEGGSILRSEEHTSELQSLMRISYAVFCLKKKKKHIKHNNTTYHANIPTKIQ